MDQTTEMLSSFACGLNYDDLTPETVHQVKRVLVDTLACALGGYDSEPAKIGNCSDLMRRTRFAPTVSYLVRWPFRSESPQNSPKLNSYQEGYCKSGFLPTLAGEEYPFQVRLFGGDGNV